MQMSKEVNIRLGAIEKSRQDLVEEVNKRWGKISYNTFTQVLNGYVKPKRNLVNTVFEVLAEWERAAGIRIEISQFHFEPVRIFSQDSEGNEVRQDVPRETSSRFNPDGSAKTPKAMQPPEIIR